MKLYNKKSLETCNGFYLWDQKQYQMQEVFSLNIFLIKQWYVSPDIENNASESV